MPALTPRNSGWPWPRRSTSNDYEKRGITFGPNAANEYCDFVIGAELNEYGKKLFGYVQTLLKLGLLELRDSDEGETFVSVAPWHSRMV
jgi:hypothetical protein